MLVEEFAKKHDLCPAGHEMMKPFLKKTVREWWEDSSQAPVGTWLFWLLSRAPVDHKSIVKAACQCARETLPLFPDQSKPAASLEVIEGWCSGKKSKDEARAAGHKATELAAGAKGTPASHAWSAISQVGRTVDAATNAPAVTGTISYAFQQAGKGTIAQCEAKLAEIIRKAFTWKDIEQSIGEGKPSPLPRPTTPDEVAATADKRLAAYKDVLSQAEEAQAQLESFCREERISLDGVSRLLDQNGAGETVSRLVRDAVSNMAAADARDEAGRPAEKSKPPKRGRMMV